MSWSLNCLLRYEGPLSRLSIFTLFISGTVKLHNANSAGAIQRQRNSRIICLPCWRGSAASPIASTTGRCRSAFMITTAARWQEGDCSPLRPNAQAVRWEIMVRQVEIAAAAPSRCSVGSVGSLRSAVHHIAPSSDHEGVRSFADRRGGVCVRTALCQPASLGIPQVQDPLHRRCRGWA